MKHTTSLLLAIFMLTACVDSAAPPGLAETADVTFVAARSVSSGPTILPTLGGNFAQAFSINDAGVVVGYAAKTNSSRTVAGVSYAAKWIRDPVDGRWAVKALGESLAPDGQTINPSPGGQALAVNERGDAVGLRGGSAIMWPAAGGEIALPDGVVAQGINNAGIVVGGTVWGNTGTALVWIPDAGSESGWTSRQLRPLAGGTFALAFAINERGVIAGGAVSADGRDHAVVWFPSADGWSAPVPLSGAEASPASSVAFGINAGEDVVGAYSSCPGCGFRASFWPATGGRVDLSAFYSNANASHTYGIEDEQRVVGRFSDRNGSTNPFLWKPGNTAFTDLGTGVAKDINNRAAFYGQEAVGFSPGSKGTQATVWRIK
jgi:probable HAF family extracellular repeat protein